MKDQRLTFLSNPSQIPENMSEEEARKFWDTHEITEEFLLNSEVVPEHALPPVRPRTAFDNVHHDGHLLQRVEGVSKDQVGHIVEQLVRVGEYYSSSTVASGVAEVREQSAKLAKIAAQVEGPVGSQISHFGSALSYYQENGIGQTARRELKQSFRRAARITEGKRSHAR